MIKVDTNRQKGVKGGKGLPPKTASRAIREYLAVMDDAAFGAATEIVPKFISLADPAARWTGCGQEVATGPMMISFSQQQPKTYGN